MVYLVLVCTVGALIGLYWKVFALLPIAAILAVASSAFSILGGESALSVLTSTVIALVALQGGYMIGLTSRELIEHLFARENAATSKRI